MRLEQCNDLLPLLTIIESCGKIKLYSQDFDQAVNFFEYDDQSRFNASLMLLGNIGEHVKSISNQTKSRAKEVDWLNITGIRNRIAHDYTGIDYERIFDVVSVEIPALSKRLYGLLYDLLVEGLVDIEELKVAIGSPFYRHVDFDQLLPL